MKIQPPTGSRFEIILPGGQCVNFAAAIVTPQGKVLATLYVTTDLDAEGKQTEEFKLVTEAK